MEGPAIVKAHWLKTRRAPGTTYFPVDAERREEWTLTELQCVTIDKGFVHAMYMRNASEISYLFKMTTEERGWVGWSLAKQFELTFNTRSASWKCFVCT